MKSLISYFMMPLCLGLAFFGTKFADASSELDSIARAGNVTCYNNYSSGGSWNIYKCNGCEQQDNVRSYSGRGSCSTSSY